MDGNTAVDGVRRATLVMIASAGHSGSTLLDLLLGNHSQVTSAGEMNRLTLHAADRVCACGQTVTACTYWNAVRTVISRRRGDASVFTWDRCHTDVPPQHPIASLDAAAPDQLADGAPLAGTLRQAMAAAGLTVGDRAILIRSGVRDFKWRVQDPGTKQAFVLRRGENRIDVYDAAVSWKNPVRLLPSALEVALAAGRTSAVRAVRACSPAAREYERIAQNSWDVTDAMAEVSGVPFVIDSSKSPLRLKLLYMLRPQNVRIIELVRDGRAVSASAMRRRQLSAAMAARIWKRDNQHLALMLRSIPQRVRMRVRYESLCEYPEAEMRRLGAFLDLPFESEMLTLWSRPVHNIPGNPMLFDRSHRAIRKDERWRHDLSPADVRAFDRAAGRFNRALGYV